MTRLFLEGSSIEGRGPWSFGSFRDEDAISDGDGMIRHELPCGLTLMTKAGGTCDRCTRSITFIVILENKGGDTVHVGADCADYLLADETDRATMRRANAELRAAMRHERRLAAFEASRPAREAARAARAARAAERSAEIEAVKTEFAADIDRASSLLSHTLPGSFPHSIASRFLTSFDRGECPPDWTWEGLERYHGRLVQPSKGLGTVGGRTGVEGTVTRVHCLDKSAGPSRWDTKYLVELTTREGDVVVLFLFWRAIIDGPFKTGDMVSVDVEVREHKGSGVVGDEETVASKPRKAKAIAEHIPPWHAAVME